MPKCHSGSGIGWSQSMEVVSQIMASFRALDLELQRLEDLVTGLPSKEKSKSAPINDSLDSLLASLQSLKDTCDTPDSDLPTLPLLQLANTLETTKKNVDSRQKEIYASMARVGKTIDKTFASPLPSYPHIFSSKESSSALDRTVALHFLRTGEFDLAQTFLEESGTHVSPHLRAKFLQLHEILQALRHEDTAPALQWVAENREFLDSRSSCLEFSLHRSQYLRTLLSPTSSGPGEAILYAKTHLSRFMQQYPTDVQRLMACIIHLPLERMQNSRYKDLASPALHEDLQPLFAKVYCASLGLGRQVPLQVVSEIGGGGALSRIEKGKKVLRDSKSDWSRREELPIEIQLRPENRYHSIFSCPVSKEQSTVHNPPKILPCGHVISSDSLKNLSKTGGRAKCPYCPTEFQAVQAFQLYF
ncbi:CTLH/CRA C-terminal to lish motif domain-containing protein [Flagelloscypha sp. PMI_526]|nr:CTLH/CRA C-terminal to lish motif domain-containing protein [Flagelloscypha sp. PMI_526]